MKFLTTWTVYCFILILTVGCTQQAVKPSAPTIVQIKTDNEILAYAQRFGAMSAEEQKKEQAAVMQSLNRNKHDLALRMKAALAFGLPASRQRDNARALALLDEVQRDGSADADTRALAVLLKEYVSERQKLEENAAKSAQKAAEEQKRADGLQQKADGLQQKAESLQQKLDELKNIEKALTERDNARQK